MTYYLAYDKDTGNMAGWYTDLLHTNIPEPNIEVSDDDYLSLHNALSAGNKIITVVDGKASLVDAPAPAVTWDMIREQRDLLISQTDWSQLKDVDDDTATKYTKYRQALRDVPQKFATPDAVVWPTLEA